MIAGSIVYLCACYRLASQAHTDKPPGSASAILYNFTHSDPGATSVFTGQYRTWIVLYFSATMYINVLASGKSVIL